MAHEWWHIGSEEQEEEDYEYGDWLGKVDEKETYGTAGDINYREFEPFFNEQGEIIDFNGLANYVRVKFPELWKELAPDIKGPFGIEMEGSEFVGEGGELSPIQEADMHAKLKEVFSFMPGMMVDPSDVRAVKGEQTSLLEGLLGDIKQKKLTEESGKGISGVYSEQYDPLNPTGYKSPYGDIAKLTAASKNIYGLGTEKEVEFVDWATDVFQGAQRENIEDED
jgi:hypothetical protein